MRVLVRRVAVVACMLLSGFCPAQQASSASGLTVVTSELHAAELHRPYQSTLQAAGGLTPYRWEITAGAPPPGIVLGTDGQLAGIPEQAGDYHFTVTLSDGGKPAHQVNRDFSLRVVTPLLAEWGNPPRVNGQRLEGSIKISNSTDHDFDLTMIALAVNETGRATAIGYQRLQVPKGTIGLELPFGENLPFGSYQLNVDVVAEVASTHSIYRARLVPDQRLQIQQGP
jgi:hypothetical protein